MTASIRSAGLELRRKSSTTLSYLALLLSLLVFLGPLFWLLSTAFKRSEDVYAYPPHWVPTYLDLQNFVDAWNSAPFLRYAVNSVVVAVVGTALEMIFATLCAYAFAFIRFPLKNPLFGILLGAMMIPGHVVLLPNYLTISDLGWINSYAGLIAPGLGSVFVTFLMRQHMLTVPRELIEAATVDGAGLFRRLWQIVVPVSKPILVTGAIITIIHKWNDYVWPLVVTTTEDMRTLPIGLAFLRVTEGQQKWGAIMAGTVLVAIPMLIAYSIAQRQIVDGLTQGAVTG